MRKLFTILFISVVALSFCPIAQADLINTEKMAEMRNNTNDVAGQNGAGYDDRSLDEIIVSGIRLVTSLLGALFVVLIFVAGNNWMQAGGNEEKAKKAKDTIAALLTGLVIILVSFALASGMGGIISKVLLK